MRAGAMKKIPLLLPSICIICILAVQLVLSCVHGSAHILEELGLDADRTHETAHAQNIPADSCPDHDHGDPGHDHLSSDHHSPLYLLTANAVLTPASHAAHITVCEPFAVLPEVYLERFIPPQNLA